MYLAKVSINRPVFMTMVITVFLIFGIISYRSLNTNTTPEVEIPFITIMTIYPGAGPKEIETQISKKLEDAVATVSQIKKLESYSLDGVSIVVLEFELDKDVDVANQEIKDKVDEIVNELPDDAELPIVQKVDLQAFPIIDVVLSGDLSSKQLYELADKQLKDRFSQVKGVARVTLTGGQEREIQVQMDDRTVFENSISLPQMIQILAAHNMDLPSGYFKIDDYEYTVRVEGTFDDLEQIRELEVPTSFGPKKINQFAEVIDGGKNIRERAVYYNNKSKVRDENVVRLSIIKSIDGNVVKVADKIKEELPEIRESLPPGANLEIINDNSTFTKDTRSDTESNIILGIIFTSIILLAFLYDIRSTFIVALSMPTSIIATFMLIDFAGFSMNMMSLMGLSVSVGVLVANSVVVLENIFRHKNLGKDKKEAAYIGTSEVTTAVIAATLTNIVVFVPIANISSMVGQFLRELALTAAFSTIFSLFISFTLTPMLASLILPNKQASNAFTRFFESFESNMRLIYKRMLGYVLKNKIVSLVIVVAGFALFIITSMIYLPRIGNEFMPVIDDGKIKIEVELPTGYNLNETAETLKEIESIVSKRDEVSHIITNLGKSSDLNTGTNLAIMEVHLINANTREYGIMDMVSVFINDLANVPNAKIKVSQLEGVGGPGEPVEFYLLGQELDKLEEYKTQVMENLKDIPGLINVDNSSRSGKPEISVIPIREKMSEAGLTAMDLAITLRAAVEGIESTQYRDLGEEYDIKITLNDESVNTPEKIKNIPIVSMKGTYRIAQVADVKFTTGYTRVLRRDKYKAIQFTGSNAAGYPLGQIIDSVDARLINEDTKRIDLPTGYRFQWSSNAEMMEEMFADLTFAFFLAFLLTYMLLAALLESFTQPVIILLTLPLAFIGVFIALYYTGNTLNLTSMMGLIMLIGIVVNNAILMLDYTNQLRREDEYLPKDALLEACPIKLKPIIMSTSAIILGMLPMALGIGEAGKEMRIPLGVVSIGGLIASTVLTLFIVPAFYYITSRKKVLQSKQIDE